MRTVRGLNGFGKWWPLGVIVGVFALLGIWHWVLRAEVVSYGDPAKNYFNPASATEGDEIELCFDDITWFRLCRGRLVTYLTPAAGQRLDLVSYTINTPTRTGKVPPKCRKWVVPSLGERQAGTGTLGGHAEFNCGFFAPRMVTPLPPIKLNITKK